MNALVLLLGVAFGVVLSRSGASDYAFIQRMFLLQDVHMYGLIGSAVAVTLPGLWWLKRRGKTLTGEPLVVRPKPRHAGNVVGGLLFGAGWAVTGMCPGPVLVEIGEGKLYAIAALFGVLAGTWLVGALYPRVAPALRMPGIDVGPGAG